MCFASPATETGESAPFVSTQSSLATSLSLCGHPLSLHYQIFLLLKYSHHHSNKTIIKIKIFVWPQTHLYHLLYKNSLKTVWTITFPSFLCHSPWTSFYENIPVPVTPAQHSATPTAFTPCLHMALLWRMPSPGFPLTPQLLLPGLPSHPSVKTAVWHITGSYYCFKWMNNPQWLFLCQ